MVAMPSAQAGELNLYSMNTGSYVYHMTGNHGQYNEHFNNNFFSVERKFSQDSKYSVLVGTMKNSFDDRCLTLGVRRDWLKNDTGWVLKGVYAYTGEFFFDAFSHCGDSGTYRTAKKITGIGFSPYLYHGLQYNFTDYFGVEGGIIVPAIFVMSVQWSLPDALLPERAGHHRWPDTDDLAAGINGSRDGSDPTGRSGPRSRRFQRSPPGATAQRFPLAMDSFNHARRPVTGDHYHAAGSNSVTITVIGFHGLLLNKPG